MSLGVRIAQKQRITLAQAGVSPIYGIARDKQGMRPSALNLQVIRNAGTSVHSVLVEGAGDLAGPWETLATITDQLITKYTTKIPDYVRATATTSTGGTVDFLIEGAVSGGGTGGAAGPFGQSDITGGFVDLTTNQTVAGNKTLSGTSVFNNSADKLGQASSTANSAAINTTETIIVQSAAIGANRLVVGTTIRVVLDGTCTSTAANGSNFRLRIGTAGTTADAQAFIVSTPGAATSGTNIPFRAIIELTVRTTGASGTAVGLLTVLNQDITGLLTTVSLVKVGIMAAFDTTANNILTATYNSAGSTTTSTFQIAYIEIVNK